MNHKIFFTFDASGKYKYMYIIGPTLILMYMYTTKRYERNEKNDSNETRQGKTRQDKTMHSNSNRAPCLTANYQDKRKRKK